MHDVYTLGATLAVILIGLLYNGKQINDLRAEIRETRTEVLGRIDGLQRDMMQFAREQGRHDGRLDALERGRAS